MVKILKFLFLVIVIIIIYDVINQKTKHSAKSSRLECHKNTVVFERVFDKQELLKAQSSLKNGHYIIHSKIKFAKYMDTQIGKYINIHDIDNVYVKALPTYHKDKNNGVIIDYFIYENDKLDPGKKTKRSKLYAGYLHVNFSYNNILVYKIQIDFMDLQGKDIKNRVECSIKSFQSAE